MRPMPELKVEELPIGDLLMYQGNSKIHTHENVDNIANSIERFGYINPVLAWHNDDGEPEIVGGHGRVMAAKKVGLENIPVIFVDHLSDSERRAVSHVLNSTTLSTGFDTAILERELEELGDEFNWEDFGLDTNFEMEDLEFSDTTPKSKEVHFDDTLGVFVECADEDDQERAYMELIESGFKCRLLTL